jgi:hypothetical protein
MDPDIARLLQIINEAVERLRQRKEDCWADWLETDRRRIAALEFDGLLHVLKAYGGVGSMTDALRDSHTDQLLSDIYSLARRLQREEEMATRQSPS